MVTHSPSTPKTLLGRSTSNVSLPRMAECAVVPHCQRARSPLFHCHERLLPVTPDVPATQTTLEHTDRDRGWSSSNISSTPNAGYPTHGETGTLQPPDGDSTYPQLQRSYYRNPRLQPPTPSNQLTTTTDGISAFGSSPESPPKEAHFHGILNTDPKPPNRARRFLRKFFQMVTDNRAVLRA